MDGPTAGAHSFHRGAALANYDAQTRRAVAALDNKIDTQAVLDVWETALASTPAGPAVWVHGDISVGSLLLDQGRLCAVIDFGNLAVGDPACDLAMAWTLFEGRSREALRAVLAPDAGAWARGRGWVLWKALIIACGHACSNAFEASQPWRQMDAVLAEYRRA